MSRKRSYEMKAEASSDPGREIIAFLESDSQRGILK